MEGVRERSLAGRSQTIAERLEYEWNDDALLVARERYKREQKGVCGARMYWLT